MSETVLRAENITKRFNLEAGLFASYGSFVYAVNGVNLTLKKGETYGLVGESGCGKTTLARLMVGLYPIDDGKLELNTEQEMLDITHPGKKEKRLIRDRIKYVFQDPARSLNPRLTVEKLLTAAYRFSPAWPGKKEARREAAEVLETVGLKEQDLDRKSSEFSGGQRQRISIARALISKPEILICDEVVSALDVSIQSQILNLLLDLKQKFGLTIIFIAHDLTVTTYFCDRIGVMYRGRIMEEAPAADLLNERLHPYTRLLYDSIPERMGRPAENAPAAVQMKTGSPLSGCPFYDRCSHRQESCRQGVPDLLERKPDRFTACPVVSV